MLQTLHVPQDIIPVHLASAGVILCDGVLRGHQQRAGVGAHGEKLRGSRTLQLRAVQALQQLQVPHFASKADGELTEPDSGPNGCKRPGTATIKHVQMELGNMSMLH